MQEIEDSLEEPPLLNAHDLVVETFQGLFPDTFQGVLPVHKHKVGHCRAMSYALWEQTCQGKECKPCIAHASCIEVWKGGIKKSALDCPLITNGVLHDARRRWTCFFSSGTKHGRS